MAVMNAQMAVMNAHAHGYRMVNGEEKLYRYWLVVIA
jgi:hypothetical protein